MYLLLEPLQLYPVRGNIFMHETGPSYTKGWGPLCDVCVMCVLHVKSCVCSRAAEACLTQAHRLQGGWRRASSMQEGVLLPHITWSKEWTHHVLRLRDGTRSKGIECYGKHYYYRPICLHFWWFCITEYGGPPCFLVFFTTLNIVKYQKLYSSQFLKYNFLPPRKLTAKNSSSHLVVQEREMVRQCLGPLYAVWTGQMMAHWLAVAAPQTSPPGDQWLWLQ